MWNITNDIIFLHYKLHKMDKLEIPIIYKEIAKGGFSAFLLDYQAYGQTLEEARENVIEAMRIAFELAKINNSWPHHEGLKVTTRNYEVEIETPALVYVSESTKERISKNSEAKKYFKDFVESQKVK